MKGRRERGRETLVGGRGKPEERWSKGRRKGSSVGWQVKERKQDDMRGAVWRRSEESEGKEGERIILKDDKEKSASETFSS